MNNIDINQKNKPKATEKQQKSIGLNELCKAYGKIWNDNFARLNGNKNKIFYEIDEKRNQRTLERKDGIEYLLVRIEEYKKETGKFSAIAKIVLNIPGKWEKSFPSLSKASVKEGDKFAFYCAIDEGKNLQTAIDLLQKQGTNKISILLC